MSAAIHLLVPRLLRSSSAWLLAGLCVLLPIYLRVLSPLGVGDDATGAHALPFEIAIACAVFAAALAGHLVGPLAGLHGGQTSWQQSTAICLAIAAGASFFGLLSLASWVVGFGTRSVLSDRVAWGAAGLAVVHLALLGTLLVQLRLPARLLGGSLLLCAWIIPAAAHEFPVAQLCDVSIHAPQTSTSVDPWGLAPILILALTIVMRNIAAARCP